MGGEILPTRDLLLKEGICSCRSKFFSLKVDHLGKAAKIQMAELLPMKYLATNFNYINVSKCCLFYPAVNQHLLEELKTELIQCGLIRTISA